MGFLEILTLIFVIMKLVGVIAWSWWIVLSPILIAVGIYVLLLLLWLVAYVRLSREANKAFDSDFFKKD